MVIANDNKIGKCNFLKCNDVSGGIIGMHGMKIYSSVKGPVKIVVSMILFVNFFFTASYVPLQSLDWFIFHNMIISTPNFSCNTCGGIPGKYSCWIINHFICFHNSVDGFVFDYLTWNFTFNYSVKFMGIFVLTCKNSSFTQSNGILII